MLIKPWKLKTRLFFVVFALMALTVLGGVVMIAYTVQMEHIVSDITEKDLTAFQIAEGMESALAMQKGFVAYYFMDRNPQWLQQLGEYRQIFREKLAEARALAKDDPLLKRIDAIEADYNKYIRDKDQVIALYKSGDIETGQQFHKEVRQQFFNLLEGCQHFKNVYRNKIFDTKQLVQEQAEHLRIVTIAAVVVGCALALALIWLMLDQVFKPVVRLTRELGGIDPSKGKGNEIRALSEGVRELIEDADQTYHELKRSRETLLQAEKMALVGKLAAGMAHSLRNPFTSVKMRLFSLGRSLKLNETQQEDFDVISEEIQHIDTIVQNFLEFSRPPKLRMTRVSPSSVVDLVIRLLAHRLNSYDVTVEIRRKAMLPEIEADPEQLKEVLVNLVVNACEAMKRGGHITIEEEETFDMQTGRSVVLRVADTGPGIPEDIRENVFQPFFTTKEEGTGLGLSIAARIVQEHGGELSVESAKGQGAVFVMRFPVKRA
ncbi:MAG: ATP-binding protein [Thermodesulfobacteriota bacterium]